jgi:hypothetical protein
MKRLPAETDDEFRQRVLAGAGEKRIAKRPRAVDRDPARATANFYADRWMDMVEEHSEFASLRPWESKGATTGYLNKVFFHPESGRTYSTEEVEAMIVSFVDAVVTTRVIIKPGQSAWRRFTGWWGRDDWSFQGDDRPFAG